MVSTAQHKVIKEGKDMTYYFIKTHYTPTEANPEGVEHDWYTGKANFNANTESVFGDMSKNELWDCPYSLEHAYTRKCDATRALNRAEESNEWEEKWGHWLVNSVLVEIEG